jgi:hypothetical protein
MVVSLDQRLSKPWKIAMIFSKQQALSYNPSGIKNPYKESTL